MKVVENGKYRSFWIIFLIYGPKRKQEQYFSVSEILSFQECNNGAMTKMGEFEGIKTCQDCTLEFMVICLKSTNYSKLWAFF